jgi:hypothetical protein
MLYKIIRQTRERCEGSFGERLLLSFLFHSFITRICDINNRIEGHMILSNGEGLTDGFTLSFDVHMNNI